MKAILIAAGMGQRLRPYTDDRPKCLVEVAGKPMIQHQIDNLRRVGVTDFVVIRGYMAERLTQELGQQPGVRFVDNPQYRQNNILLSLMCAEDELSTGFYCSYGDIVYQSAVSEQLAKSRDDLALVVDPYFATVYEGRTDHPIDEAELAHVVNGQVLQVGKRAVALPQASGEFIGLWKASARAGQTLLALFRQRLLELGPNAPYGRAPRLQTAYLTDLFNDVIAKQDTLDLPVRGVLIDRPNAWREIDTVQDLHRAKMLAEN